MVHHANVRYPSGTSRCRRRGGAPPPRPCRAYSEGDDNVRLLMRTTVLAIGGAAMALLPVAGPAGASEAHPSAAAVSSTTPTSGSRPGLTRSWTRFTQRPDDGPNETTHTIDDEINQPTTRHHGGAVPSTRAPSAPCQQTRLQPVESMDAAARHGRRCPGQPVPTALSRWRHGFESRWGCSHILPAQRPRISPGASCGSGFIETA